MLALYFAFVIFGFFSAYVVSLYALAVYIDPDEIDKLLPRISSRRRSLLMKMAGDPRAFVQVAAVYRSAALIAITGLTVAIMADLIAPSMVYRAYPVGLIVLWLLHVMLVEYLPRRSSRKAINRKMIRYLWLITAIYVIFFPVVRLYRSALSRMQQADRVTEEEKEEIIERAIETLAEQAGIGEAIVEEDEKEMIGQIFLLDQTQVREIMSPRIDITGIEKSSGYAAITELVREHGYSRYPVYEGTIDRTIGILYVKDLFSNMPRPGEEFVIADYLRKPFFVPESKVIGNLLREFKSRKLHIAMVADEYGGVAGLVTLEDILEEIVGEIRDEHDSEVDEIRQLSDGLYMVDAALRVEKLQDELDVEYDQEDYDTVGGLIYDLVGSVPDRGDHVRWHDIDFEIVEVDGQRIKTVRVHRL